MEYQSLIYASWEEISEHVLEVCFSISEAKELL